MAKSRAQQAAIAMSMKAAGKKPKMQDGGSKMKKALADSTEGARVTKFLSSPTMGGIERYPVNAKDAKRKMGEPARVRAAENKKKMGGTTKAKKK